GQERYGDDGGQDGIAPRQLVAAPEQDRRAERQEDGGERRRQEPVDRLDAERHEPRERRHDGVLAEIVRMRGQGRARPRDELFGGAVDERIEAVADGVDGERRRQHREQVEDGGGEGEMREAAAEAQDDERERRQEQPDEEDRGDDVPGRADGFDRGRRGQG